jgi:hypothetical protein
MQYPYDQCGALRPGRRVRGTANPDQDSDENPVISMTFFVISRQIRLLSAAIPQFPPRIEKSRIVCGISPTSPLKRPMFDNLESRKGISRARTDLTIHHHELSSRDELPTMRLDRKILFNKL